MQLTSYLKQVFLAPKTNQFSLLITILILALYNWPVIRFIQKHLDFALLSSWQTTLTVFSVILLLTSLTTHLIFFISIRLGKLLSILFFITNSTALYFMMTYQVILDKTMIGNILNTQSSESGQYLSLTLILYIAVFGLLPSWWIVRTPVRKSSRLGQIAQLAAIMIVCVGWAWSASSTWLWIDKHGKTLGGTILPWSYAINSARYYQDYSQTHAEQFPLPEATFKDAEKTVVVLVIGESARAQNFSIYGYDRPTTPKLSQSNVIAMPDTHSCASYTTAAVSCILSHADPDSLSKNYETLPSYLQRQGISVIWRTKNWGESPIQVGSYLKASDLNAQCHQDDCDYDGVLLSGLAQQIQQAKSDKVFVVLHQTGSHGPTYNKKYPRSFAHFQPECDSVELSKCSHQELFNAYDNTILYTDDFLDRLRRLLSHLPVQNTAYLYLSDHGESLGENGLYLHGTPYSLAPDEQLRIPFIVWMSDAFIQHKGVSVAKLASKPSHNQSEIFHSVMGAFGMTSDIYRPDLDIFAYASQPKSHSIQGQ